MTIDLKSIKAKIKALSEKTIKNGCTEAEAMTAIEMVGKLLARYNLSMDEVQLNDEPCVSLKIQTKSKHRDGIYFCVASIAEFTGCKVWTTRNRMTGLSYCFFGQESDILMAQYLYDIISTAIKTETNNFKKTPEYLRAYSARGASSSFGIGMGYRIATRLQDLSRQNAKDVSAERSGNNALVVLKNRIVTEEFAKMNLRLSKSSGNKTNIKDGTAYGKGQIAGDKVNLSRPVGSSASPILAIGSH